MRLITFWSNPPRQLIVVKSGVEDGHPFVPAGHAGPKQAGQKRPAEDESLGDLRSTPRSKPFEFGRAWLVAAWRLICGLEFEGFKYQFLLGVSGLANLHTCVERCRMLASEGSGQEKEPPRRERDPFAQRVEVGWWDGSVNPVVKASFPKWLKSNGKDKVLKCVSMWIRDCLHLSPMCVKGYKFGWFVQFLSIPEIFQNPQICWNMALWPLGAQHFTIRRRRRIPKTNSEDEFLLVDHRRREDEFRRRIPRRQIPPRIPIPKSISPRGRSPLRRRIPKTNSPQTISPRGRSPLRRRIPRRRISPWRRSTPKTNSPPKTNSEDEFPADKQFAPEDDFLPEDEFPPPGVLHFQSWQLKWPPAPGAVSMDSAQSFTRTFMKPRPLVKR